MKRFAFLIGEAFVSLKINRHSVVMGILTTAFTMSCFGVFFLLYVNLKQFTGALQQDVQIIVYVAEDLSQGRLTELRRLFEREKAVTAVSFISPREALEDFHKQFPSESALLEGMGANPLPASFILSVAPRFQEADAMSALASRFQQAPGVSHVRYSREWIETLSILVRYVELGAALIGLILGAATITIIANTIRLSLYARREEIEILRLVGATGPFIATPYLLEGAMLGGFGGALSLLLLKGGFELFLIEVRESGWFQGMESALLFFPAPMAISLVMAGLLLGCASSLLSVYQLLNVSKT